MSYQQDKQLQNRVPSMDTEGFRRWYDQHRGRLLNSMKAIVRDRDAAEEVTAATVATAFEKIHQFRGDAAFDSWVQAIGRRMAYNYGNRNRTVSLDTLVLEPREIGRADIVADAPGHTENRLKLQRALRRVPRMYRVLLQDFARGYSMKEIAERHSLPVGTVLSRLFTAKRLLRRTWTSITASDPGLAT